MSNIIFALLILGMSVDAVAALPSDPAPKAIRAEPSEPIVNDLLTSYQREILFLSTYQKELQGKIDKLEGALGRKAQLAAAELQTLENAWLQLQTQNEIKLQRLSELERDQESQSENRRVLEEIIEQAKSSFGLALVDDDPLHKKIASIYGAASADLLAAGKVTKAAGTFFDQKGNLLTGDILTLGKVARFGLHAGKVGSLFPTGGGDFKIWEWTNFQPDHLLADKFPELLPVFLMENPHKEFVVNADKTWLETIQAGGLIGWVIVLLGALAAILSLIRYWLLQQAQSRNDKSLSEIVLNISLGKTQEAEEICLRQNNAVTRVVGRTLACLRKSPENVEEVIAESIIAESQIIDRFGVFILVIASIAPLLGLLGTVTGMISTFDVITQFGTGNPKLLSGGISEALITTMLGLIVAIPALLVGQWLGAVNEGIKSDMEKWALAAYNSYTVGSCRD